MEISAIRQNGQNVNLKDATGRSLLAEKQDKLIAGNGIKIEDNIISVIASSETSTSGWKDIVIKDCSLEYYSGCSYVFDATFSYKGNPKLAKSTNGYSEYNNANYIITNEGDSVIDIFSKNIYHSYNVLLGSGYWACASEDLQNELDKLEDTEDDYFLIMIKEIKFTEATLSEEGTEDLYGSSLICKPGEVFKLGVQTITTPNSDTHTLVGKPGCICLLDLSDEIKYPTTVIANVYSSSFKDEDVVEMRAKPYFVHSYDTSELQGIALSKVFE